MSVLKVAEAKCLGENGYLTLTKEKKIKNIEKIQTGQVWFVYPERKKEDAVLVCIVDLRGEIAQIVPLHNQKQLKTRIEPWVSLTYCNRCRFIAVVERTLTVSPLAFQPDCYIGKIAEDRLNLLREAVADCEDIILAHSELRQLEASGQEEKITDELIGKAFKKFLFLPIYEDLEKVIRFHTQLQSVVQQYHEKLFSSE